MAAAPDQLFNRTTTDSYSDAEISSPSTQTPAPFVACLLTVANAAVNYQVENTPGHWTDDYFLTPSAGPLPLGPCYGVRFKSAVAGTPAQVSARMLTSAQVTAAGGLGNLSPVTYNVAAAGTVSSGTTFLGRFTQDAWPPPSPSDGDTAYLVDTNNGAAWLLEFSASTKKWTPYNGDTPGSIYLDHFVSSGQGTSLTDIWTVTMPAGGDWLIFVDEMVSATAPVSADLAVGTTAGGTDLIAGKSGENAYADFDRPYISDTVITVVRLQTIHISGSNTKGSTGYPLASASLTPSSLDNA